MGARYSVILVLIGITLLYGCSSQQYAHKANLAKARMRVGPTGPKIKVDKRISVSIKATGNGEFVIEAVHPPGLDMSWQMFPDVNLYNSSGKLLDPPIAGDEGWFREIDCIEAGTKSSKKYANLLTGNRLVVTLALSGESKKLPPGKYRVEPDVYFSEAGPDAAVEFNPASYARAGKSTGCWFTRK